MAPVAAKARAEWRDDSEPLVERVVRIIGSHLSAGTGEIDIDIEHRCYAFHPDWMNAKRLTASCCKGGTVRGPAWNRAI